MVDKIQLGAVIPFESVDGEEYRVCQTLFEDHPEGDGIIVDPRSIMRMKIASVEVSLIRSPLRI